MGSEEEPQPGKGSGRSLGREGGQVQEAGKGEGRGSEAGGQGR